MPLTIRERDCHLEHATLPDRLLLARYATLPLLQVEDALSVARRLCEEAERVVLAPLLAAKFGQVSLAVMEPSRRGSPYRSSWSRF